MRIALPKPNFNIPTRGQLLQIVNRARDYVKNWSWESESKHLRTFGKDYSLPLIMTLVFLLIVGAVTIVRASQHASLAHLLEGVTEAGKGYGTLLSNDQTDAPQKNTNNGQAQAPAGSASSFAITSSPSSGSGSTGGGSSSGGGGSTTPPPAFSAAIASFEQASATLSCSKPQPKAQFCSKIYTFNGSINTQNGPGTVNYGWRSNLTSIVEDKSFSAASGSKVNSVQKVITLSCTAPTNFTLQLVITSPSFTQSAVLSVNHSCPGI